jgi:hypothetical protein
MHLETVTFDRVFDLHRWRLRRGPITVFSFSTKERTVYSVTVEGWPAVQAGMTVTAVLGRSGNWQTLLGWSNHQSGELAMRSYRQDFTTTAIVALLLLIVGAFVFGNGSPFAPQSRPLAGVLLCAFLGLLAAVLLAQGVRSLLAVRLLRRVALTRSGPNAA